MNFIKFFSAIFLFIASAVVNAVVIDGNFSAIVAYEDSDEGIWSKDLRDSEVIGEFWLDTNLGPAPQSDFPSSPDLNYYESETNSWINLTLFIDGKKIDISKFVGPTHDVTPQSESLSIDTQKNSFRIYKTITTSDPLGVGGILTIGVGLWFDPMDDYNELLFSMSGIVNEEQRYTSYMEMAIPDHSISIRNISVHEPSSLAIMLIGMLALAFRHYCKKW